MIDWMAILIVFGSLLAGASCVGYPIGFLMGRRSATDEWAEDFRDSVSADSDRILDAEEIS